MRQYVRWLVVRIIDNNTNHLIVWKSLCRKLKLKKVVQPTATTEKYLTGMFIIMVHQYSNICLENEFRNPSGPLVITEQIDRNIQHRIQHGFHF